MQPNNLHIPQDINYECTGCGTCCSGWAVPLTGADHKRIADVNWSELNPNYKGQVLFRELKKYERLGTPYEYKIVSDDGTCPFLVDKLCFIHSKRDAEFKPSICQLFPYCFTDTPSGTYATVSFVSMGALYNSGKPLTEQKDILEQKLAEFRRLFPQYKPDWSKILFATERPLSWNDYLRHEAELIRRLQDHEKSMADRLQECCVYLEAELAKQPAPKASGKNTSSKETKISELQNNRVLVLNKLDKHLLATFHKMYFPAKAQKQSERSFSAWKFWFGVLFNSSTILEFTNDYYAFDQLKEFPFPDNDREINEMLYRYMFSHIFGKKYFGAGFGQLSLITGFHHLTMLSCLIRLHAKGLAKARKAPVVSLIDVAATLRQLETQLGETTFNSSSSSTMELLLQYSSRAERFLGSA